MFSKFKGWFTALPSIGKVGVIVVASALSIGAVGATSHPSNPVDTPPVVKPYKIEHKTITTTEPVAFETKTVNDPNLTSGADKTQTEGANGVRTKTWDVTYTNGSETGRISVNDGITTDPVTKIIAHGTKVAVKPPPPNCSPHYSGACVPIASDVDCAGGNGNGPAYTQGPVYVVDYDIYGLDRDGDGVGCE